MANDDDARTGIRSGYFCRILSASALRFSAKRTHTFVSKSTTTLDAAREEPTKGVLVLELGTHDGVELVAGERTRGTGLGDGMVDVESKGAWPFSCAALSPDYPIQLPFWVSCHNIAPLRLIQETAPHLERTH